MVTQEQIDKLTWFHDFNFLGGLQARSEEKESVVLKVRMSFVSENLRLDFAGKTVIDVGCWDGYFAFLAEDLGASSVLAVDDFSQNYGSPECFRLAKELKQSDVTLLPDVSVYELSRRVPEKFDVILFLGVYYHLHSPYTALAEIRSLCHDESIVVIEGECARDDNVASARFRLASPEVPFLPTTRLLGDMLHSCYLRVERMAFMSEFRAPEQIRLAPSPEVLRAAHQAIKQKRLHPEASKSGALRERVILFATPFRGENRMHVYKPPFGLAQFDTRATFHDR